MISLEKWQIYLYKNSLKCGQFGQNNCCQVVHCYKSPNLVTLVGNNLSSLHKSIPLPRNPINGPNFLQSNWCQNIILPTEIYLPIIYLCLPTYHPTYRNLCPCHSTQSTVPIFFSQIGVKISSSVQLTGDRINGSPNFHIKLCQLIIFWSIDKDNLSLLRTRLLKWLQRSFIIYKVKHTYFYKWNCVEPV